MKKILAILFYSFGFSAWATEIVVPYAPGGAADSVGRAMAKYLEKTQSKNITVTNRSGASGTVGTQWVLTQPATGRTMVVANSGSFIFNKVFFKSQTYDYKDFDVMGPFAQTPAILSVGDTNIKNINDLVALSKRRPITCGSSSTSGMIVGRILLQRLNISNAEIIIYRGSSEVVSDLLGRHIDCSIDTFSPQMSHWKNKTINIIAVAAESAHRDLPGVPLFRDHAPDLVFYFWYGLAVPRSVDADVRKSIAQQIQNIYRDPDFQNTMSSLGLEHTPGVSDTQRWMDQQYQRFDRMRADLGIQKQ